MNETVSSVQRSSNDSHAAPACAFPRSSTPAAELSTECSDRPQIPDHELLRPIAAGAYGEVWLSRNAVGTLRAVKIVRSERHASAESFEREFKGLQKFEPLSRTHDGLVDILTLGLLPDIAGFYYVMELADQGEPGLNEVGCDVPIAPRRAEDSPPYQPRTLRADLKSGGAVPADEVIALGLKLTPALAHLHAHGLVHRDVKPSNILFVSGEPKLADAGLVAAVDDARSLVGTAGYIAPEGPGTPSADLYALGKVLYEAAFGKDRQEFPALPADVSSRPDHRRLLELNAILLKACAADARERYQSADQMRADLELLLAGRSVKRRQAWRQCGRYAKKVALTLGALTVITTAVVGFLHPFTHPAFFGDGSLSKFEDANTFCDQAFRIIRSDDYARFQQAYTNLNRAIELDPKFALPYAGLLELRLGDPRVGPPKNPEELRAITDKLRELAPDLAATHCAQSILSFRDLDFVQARKFALKAINADPKYELGHTHYGWMLLAWGWPVKAREQFEISHELNRSKMTIECYLANTYYFERDYANALSRHRKALQFNPLHPLAWQCIGEIYRAMGDYENCIENMEKADLLRGAREAETKELYNGLRRAVEEQGARGYWEEWRRRSEKNPKFENYWKAVYQLKLGDTNAALDLLGQSFRIRQRRDGSGAEFNLTWLLYHEFWDDLRDDPRFKALLNKIGFSKVMPVETVQ